MFYPLFFQAVKLMRDHEHLALAVTQNIKTKQNQFFLQH